MDSNGEVLEELEVGVEIEPNLEVLPATSTEFSGEGCEIQAEDHQVHNGNPSGSQDYLKRYMAVITLRGGGIGSVSIVSDSVP